MTKDKWNDWNLSGGPKYPHNKVVQYVFRNFPDRSNRLGVATLDLGCGGGVNSLLLAQEGFEVHGVDIAPAGVARTAELLHSSGFNGDIQVGSVDNINYKDNSFAFLISVGVLECVDYQALKKGFSEVFRVLKPGGKAILIFASDLDFRLKGENPLALNGWTDSEVMGALEGILHGIDVQMDRYITTYMGGQSQQNEHLITLIKK
jgi:2-polyprenyl-3-methyl-5-hydroxy-6-metoxy-1,4-benzoquinol methylase